MGEKIVITLIVVLSIVAVGMGAYVILAPTVEPVEEEPIVVVEQIVENELPAKLGIIRENKERTIARMFAIRNYVEKLEPKEINMIDNLKFLVLDPEATQHMLILPFEVGGEIIISKLIYDDYTEKYYKSDNPEDIVYKAEVTPGYGLLLKYNRPTEKLEYLIEHIQGDIVTSYKIDTMDDLPTYEQIVRDKNEEE